MGMSVGIYQRLGNMFSPTTKRALGSNPTCHARRVTVGNLTHPWTASQVMRSSQQKNWKREEDDNDDEESSFSSNEVSPDASDLE